MEINVTFLRFIRRNEKSGVSKFSARDTNGKTVLCKGICFDYPANIPLTLTGEVRLDEKGNVPVFYFDKAHVNSFDIETTVDFLSSGFFSNVGTKRAHALYSSFNKIFPGENLFAKLEDCAGIKVEDFSAESLRDVIDKCKYLHGFEQLFEYFEGLEEYSVVASLYAKYGPDTISSVEENPYIILAHNGKIVTAETLARRYGYRYNDYRRTYAWTKYLMYQNRKCGNTRVNVSDLINRFKKQEARIGLYETSPIFILEGLCEEKLFVTEAEGSEVYAYIREDYYAESIIIRELDRLQRTAMPLSTIDTPISEIEKKANVIYSEEQKLAFKGQQSGGVYIITGGPGVGKTTTISGLIQKFMADNPDKNFALCAPTGCAADTIHQASGYPAETVHKLLDIRLYETIEYMNVQKLNVSMVIVDESSMLDTYLLARLLLSLNDGTTLALVGDPDQLPSVAPGNVFSDLIKSGKIPVYRLTQVYRQDEHNLIIENSRKVKDGVVKLKTGDSFRIRRFDNTDDLLCGLQKTLADEYEKNSYKIYTPARDKKFEIGSVRLNYRLQSFCNRNQSETVDYGDYRFKVNDKVIFNYNNYDSHYYNGQEGTIINIQKILNHLQITVLSNNETVTLSGDALNDIELSYVLTAHKAQGSECENAIVVIPKEPQSLLKRQLLYVEITRAKKKVLLLVEGNALEQCIGYKGIIHRETGLLNKLITKEKNKC